MSPAVEAVLSRLSPKARAQGKVRFEQFVEQLGRHPSRRADRMR